MRFVAWLTVRRVRSSWRLMLASAFGVLLAVTVIAGAVLYSDAQAEAGLRYALAPRVSSNLLSLKVVVEDRPLGRSDYERLDTVVKRTVQDHLGWLHQGEHRLGHSRPMPFLIGPDRLTPFPDTLDAYLFFQGRLQDNTRLIEGRWPQQAPETLDGGPRPLEVVIGAEVAELLGWAEGQELYLVPFDTAPTEHVPLVVVGVVEATDPDGPYWFGDNPRLELQEQDPIDQDDAQFLVPLYVREADFFNGLGARYPMLLGNYWWYESLDTGSLTAGTAPRAADALEALEDDLARAFPRSDALSQLGAFVASYERDLGVARVPLFLFSSLVVGVVLYYLVLVSWLLARSRGPETALLRSRGATRFQVATLLGLGEGLVVTVPAVVAGPFLALAIVRVLPADELGLADLSIGLSPSLFAFAGLGGLACIAVFLASGLSVAGQSIVQFLRERTRPIGSPAVYRYAIDLLVLAALGMVWWQIQGRGGFLTERLLGEGLEVDLTLLVGPAIGLLAVGLLLLRVLPYVLRLLAALARSFRGVWLVHGLNRMARDPLPYGAVAVLLMLVTGIGVFGATLGPTLTRGQSDQARYAIGAEFVVTTLDERAARFIERQQERLAAVPGMHVVSAVNRGNMVLTRTSIGGVSANLLWVDPAEVGKAMWFRPDFADKDVEELLRPLLKRRSERPAGAIVLEGAERIGMWVQPQRAASGYNFWVRLRDKVGLYESVLMGRLDFDEWTYMEVPLPDRVHLTPPFSLAGFYITGSVLTGFGAGSLAIDAVTAVVDGEQRVVEPFEALGVWEPMPNLATVQDTVGIERSAAHSGNGGIRFRWIDPPGREPRGFFISPVPLPLPAIGGPSFVPGQLVWGRIEAQPIVLEIKDVADYFPTLNPDTRPFLLVDMEGLRTYQRVMPRPRPSDPTEFWFALEEGADRAEVRSVLEELVELIYPFGELHDREEKVLQAQGNPLIGGVWNGLPWIALVTLGGVAVLGFVLYGALLFERTRVEVGLLRALGFTRRQIGLVLGVEGSVVAAVGIGVGAAVGVWLGRWVIGYLDVTVEGRSLVPPLSLVLDGRLMAFTYLSVTLAGVLGTLLVLTLANRLRLADVLRVEE